MRTSIMRLATPLLLLLPFTAAQSSCVKTKDKCGDNSGFSCCESGNFCQPWEDGYYQCIPTPSGCGSMETDIDFSGEDLESFFGLKLPSDCCDKCNANPQCTAFTFINQWGPACYLKKSTGMRRTMKGAVSGLKVVATPAPTPPPAPTPAPSSCVKAGDKCGDKTGFSCCSSGNFCQPWEDGYYQCISIPSGCSDMETDVDYSGDDLESFMGLKLPSDCCDKCKANPQCTSFTFINQWGPACYLKKGTGTKKPLKGAVSGRRTPPCPTKPQESCGTSQGTTCCPAGNYCQPWDANWYQCIAPATGCGDMETDIDYFGADIASFQVQFPWDCCQKCRAQSDCKFFTFVNNASGGPMCYLKSSDAGRRVSKGAVSGRNIEEATPSRAPSPTPPQSPKPTPPPTTCVDTGLACGGSVTCCDTQGAYCHPWSPTDHQCTDKPATCDAGLETDIDYFGADLRAVNNVDLADCCDACARDADCKVFTFSTTQRACYLKTSDAGRVASNGSLSGKKPTSTTPPTTAPPVTARPPSATPMPTLAPIGNWDPTRCGAQRRNIYYHGNDIAGSEKAVDTVEACCDLCRANTQCKLFTYFRRGDQKRCLLKTGATPGMEKTNYADRNYVAVASGVFA